MKKILIFGGTSEGRELAEKLAGVGFMVDLHVATEYGQQVIDEADIIMDNISVHTGRLDACMMKSIINSDQYLAVIDSTHPFAEVVSDNIVKALEGNLNAGIRVVRATDSLCRGNITYFDSSESCRDALLNTKGNILLTTGSKELSIYAQDEQLRKRLVVRVLPGMESLSLCYEAGIDGKNIIAMQGPFSVEMNEAIIKQYDIKILVSKESGKKGGVDEKLTAAWNKGIPVFMIRRPGENSELMKLSVDEAYRECLERAGISGCRMSVTLAGIGMDCDSTLTKEAMDAIGKADYIFGAERMIERYAKDKKAYPYYLEKDITPVLEEIKNKSVGNVSAVILFSGDTGFYSGAEKLLRAYENKGMQVNLLPGISSVSALAARTGHSWENAYIMSTHGVEEIKWKKELIDSVRYNKKTFTLTSGDEDVRNIGSLLLEHGFMDLTVYLGYKLGYKDERVYVLKPEELEGITDKGLYVIMLVNVQAEKRRLTPYLSDEDFLRDSVPMTKEEIRHLSVCKLHIEEGDVIYDIGSGTGSVTCEMAKLSAALDVYAIECNEDAVRLTENNIHNMNLLNVTVINGTAPEALDNLPAADKAFIGGSRGNLKSILDKLKMINSNMRVVMNAVSMESILEMQQLINEYAVRDVSITQVQVSRTKRLGAYNMLTASNPVFIFAFTFTEE